MARRIWTSITDMDLAEELASYFDRLWPLLRSLTGEGLRQTLAVLSELVPLRLIQVPTGTPVFDWIVPKEWVVRQAYVIDPEGRRILDVKQNTLHLVNYSVGFRGKIDRAELDEHLHSRPDLPNAIPYVTSYYEPRWGFCLSENQRRALAEGEYQVVIDADHINGAMTLGEAVLPGGGKSPTKSSSPPIRATPHWRTMNYPARWCPRSSTDTSPALSTGG